MPKDGLAIVQLATGAVTRIEDVKSFSTPTKGGAWLAYLKGAKPEEKKPADTTPTEKPAGATVPDDDDAADQQRGGSARGGPDASGPRTLRQQTPKFMAPS